MRCAGGLARWPIAAWAVYTARGRAQMGARNGEAEALSWRLAEGEQ